MDTSAGTITDVVSFGTEGSDSKIDCVIGKRNMMFEPFVVGLEKPAFAFVKPEVSGIPAYVITEHCRDKTVVIIGSYWNIESIQEVAAVAKDAYLLLNEETSTGFDGIPGLKVVSLTSPWEVLIEKVPLNWERFGMIYNLVLRCGMVQTRASFMDEAIYKGIKIRAMERKMDLILDLAEGRNAFDFTNREVFDETLYWLAFCGREYVSDVFSQAKEFAKDKATPYVVGGNRVLVIKDPPGDIKFYLQAVTEKAEGIGGFASGVVIRTDPHVPSVLRIAAMPTKGGSAEWLREPPFNGGGNPNWVGASMKGKSFVPIQVEPDLLERIFDIPL